MLNKNKKLRVNKETIKPLANEQLEGMAGGAFTYSYFGQDTCAAACTQYNCDYSIYRNCTQ
jgi:hypothetical protein